MGFNYLFIFPPCYVAFCACKARHRLSSEIVSWCLETSLFLRLPSRDRAPSLPLLSLFLSFIFFPYLLSKTMGCFSGCLMSSVSIQKLFCGIYSAFKCSFDEFVGENVVSPSYSSAILGPPPASVLFNMLSRLVIVFLPRSKHLLISWLQSPSAVDFGAPKNKICHCFHCFPNYLP